VTDQLVERWRALDAALTATIDQLDRHLEEFSTLCERSAWLWRRVRPAMSRADAEQSYEGWCELLGLDRVDEKLCDLASRITAV
jgi:hypothetical protein